MTRHIDAIHLLESYVGRTITTFIGRPNTVTGIEGDLVLVGTKRSPAGQKVKIELIQTALD